MGRGGLEDGGDWNAEAESAIVKDVDDDDE
jgi:hypothetical protein